MRSDIQTSFARETLLSVFLSSILVLSLSRIEICSLLCSLSLSMMVLELKSKLESSYKLGHITHGHHTTNINICKTFYLRKEQIMWFVKWLALSQEMLSCLRACSTHSAGRVHSKPVEHCSVALEGVYTSKETAFKLCSYYCALMTIHDAQLKRLHCQGLCTVKPILSGHSK